MKKTAFLIVLTLFFFTAGSVQAVSDPLSLPNNKYGIHIVDENDLESAAALVNSSGGDWGYVTLVIPERERNVEKWRSVFEKINRFHLIPIVRLATEPIGSIWKKPEVTDASSWADFLLQLNWPVKNRYVVIFNEPNHAKEWGNTLNPEEYAEILTAFSKTLKERSSDFFILPAGLDASAPNSKETMDEKTFLKAMLQKDANVFSAIDGWTSHSYPNPGFTGSIFDKGKGSLRTFEWELNILKSWGVDQNLPIYITETGWPHQEGITNNQYLYSAEDIAEFIRETAETIWNNPQIAAVTPFVLNYQSFPFSNFSWQKPGRDIFYPQYDTYRSIVKVAGRPILNETSVLAQNPNVLGAKTQSTKKPKESIISRLSYSLFSWIFNL